MDDILLAHSKGKVLEFLLKDMIQTLTSNGLVITPDKIQKNKPLNYLGQVIHKDFIVSQKISLRKDRLKTLNDFQKLLGDINWLRPYLKITTGTLSPLYSILHGDSNPKSIRTLTPKALTALQIVKQALSNARVKQLDYNKI